MGVREGGEEGRGKYRMAPSLSQARADAKHHQAVNAGLRADRAHAHLHHHHHLPHHHHHHHHIPHTVPVATEVVIVQQQQPSAPPPPVSYPVGTQPPSHGMGIWLHC